MTLKKCYLILLFLFHLSFLIAQNVVLKNYSLNWNDNTEIQLDKDNKISLPLVKNNFFNNNKIPLYSTSFNVENNLIVHDFQIKNVKFSNLSKNLIKNINIQDVPTEMDARFNIGFSSDQSIAILSLNPLIQENNQIKKLISFTLEYSLQTKSQSFLNKNVSTPVYAVNSVLSSGSWFKFAIDTTGVFKIDKSLLNEIGLDVSNINPKNIRIFGNGGAQLAQLNSEFRYDDLQENAIYVSGEDDLEFDDEDYILFYGQGPHSWNINPNDISLSKHQFNLYSDFSYYFVTVDLGQGIRVDSGNEIQQPSDELIDSFQDFLFHEIDETNLFANGQQWMGEDFSFEQTQNVQFYFDNIDNSSDLYIRMRAVASAFTNTIMTAKVNNQALIDLRFSALSTSSFNLADSEEQLVSFNSSQEQINVEINYDNLANPSSRCYLDYIEIIGTKKLSAQGKQFSFRNVNTNVDSRVYEYHIQNNNQIEQVWEVTDPLKPNQINNQSKENDFVFKSLGGDLKEFIVLNSSDYFTPITIENHIVQNQNLHQLTDIDYVIITPDFLNPEAERLAEFHRAQSNLNTLVVPLNKIYNEFGSGSPDITAIRDFIRFLYQNATSSNTRIKYVCLFGDSSFDFKDRITSNTNVVPAFQSYESFNLVTSYVTDDYFGMMDENEGLLNTFDLQDVITGRYPVNTLIEAKHSIDKTLNYYSVNSFGDWRNHMTFVADDPDQPNEFVLQKTVDLITEDVKTNKPNFNIKKIYADAHQQETSAGGERYPTVNEAITNSIETGTLIVNYFGHGGAGGWANERILEVLQIKKWNNPNALPLFIAVTCEFSRFDNPLRKSAGEYTLLNPHGGATSMISTTREIFIGIGQIFNRSLFKNLLGYENENYTIGEALMRTKHEFTSPQRFFIHNFGDPAMRLSQPKTNVLITKLNDKETNQVLDTLKALSHIKIDGIVTDQNNNILDDFKGNLSATIYDKPLNKSTLDNDNFGNKMEFTSIESKIFRGRASVDNGRFSFDFIVPKDIRIAYGNAKVSFYANDLRIDRSGYDLKLIIGGIDANAPSDVKGPDIQLFMNDESFVDGGNTSQSPLLYAILEDESGINTSITSVDHDIIAILDDDNANPIVLNDFYETDLDNFKKGKVKFTLRELKPGLHSLKFKCWDTYNNPSESTLSFIVVDDNDLILSNVLNYPNPFLNYTEFWFNHNKPNESLEVLVQIFTVSGKLIKTLYQSVQSDGLLSREITWDGLDDFGNKIGKGVYIYKLQVKSLLSSSKAEKIEKLVILQ